MERGEVFPLTAPPWATVAAEALRRARLQRSNSPVKRTSLNPLTPLSPEGRRKSRRDGGMHRARAMGDHRT